MWVVGTRGLAAHGGCTWAGSWCENQALSHRMWVTQCFSTVAPSSCPQGSFCVFVLLSVFLRFSGTQPGVWCSQAVFLSLPCGHHMVSGAFVFFFFPLDLSYQKFASVIGLSKVPTGGLSILFFCCSLTYWFLLLSVFTLSPPLTLGWCCSLAEFVNWISSIISCLITKTFRGIFP